MASKKNSSRLSLNEPFVKIYVKNLDTSYGSTGEIEKLFRAYGTITNVQLVRTGIAYVTFAQPFMAIKACQAMNGIKNKSGQSISVCKAITQKERFKIQERMETLGFWRVGVELAPPKTDNQDDNKIFQTFCRFGTILSYRRYRNKKGEYLAFGHIVYKTKEAALRAISKANGTVIGGRTITVKKLQPGYMTIHERMLFVQGVQCQDTLTKVFQMYGTIEDIELRGNNNLITYTDKAMVERALANRSLIKSMIPIRDLCVERVTQMHYSDKIPVIEIECKICLDIKSVEGFFSFGCRHSYCFDCLKNLLELSIKDRTIGQMCPHKSCSQIADESIIRLFVCQELFNKYKSMIWHRQIISSIDVYREQDKLSESFINKTYGRCTYCLMPIERIEGCSHMECIVCNKSFVYITPTMNYH